MSKASNALPNRPSKSKQRWDQVSDLDSRALHHVGHDSASVTCFRVTTIAEQGDAFAGFDQRDQLFKLRLCVRRLDVLVVNAPQRIDVAIARCGASFRRCAELLQMDVGYPGVVKRSSELTPGKTGPA